MQKLILKAVRLRSHAETQKDSLHPRAYKFFVLTYLATLLISFHYYLVTYANSSFLSQYLNDRTIGILYTAGSLINICLFFFIGRFLKRFGNYKVMLAVLILEAFILIILGTQKNISLIAPIFILYHAINPLLIVCLDIFLERQSRDESTGAIRGVFLTNPMGYIIGTLLGSVSLIIFPYQYIFYVLAAFLTLGLAYSLKLKDTR